MFPVQRLQICGSVRAHAHACPCPYRFPMGREFFCGASHIAPPGTRGTSTEKVVALFPPELSDEYICVRSPSSVAERFL